jgi:hypothetical protein
VAALFTRDGVWRMPKIPVELAGNVPPEVTGGTKTEVRPRSGNRAATWIAASGLVTERLFGYGRPVRCWNTGLPFGRLG